MASTYYLQKCKIYLVFNLNPVSAENDTGEKIY